MGRALSLWPARRDPAGEKRRDLARRGLRGVSDEPRWQRCAERRKWREISLAAMWFDDEQFERAEGRQRGPIRRWWWPRRGAASWGEWLTTRSTREPAPAGHRFSRRSRGRLEPSQRKALRGLCSLLLDSAAACWMVELELLGGAPAPSPREEGALSDLQRLYALRPSLQRRLARWRELARARVERRQGEEAYRRFVAETCRVGPG